MEKVYGNRGPLFGSLKWSWKICANLQTRAETGAWRRLPVNMLETSSGPRKICESNCASFLLRIFEIDEGVSVQRDFFITSNTFDGVEHKLEDESLKQRFWERSRPGVGQRLRLQTRTQRGASTTAITDVVTSNFPQKVAETPWVASEVSGNTSSDSCDTSRFARFFHVSTVTLPCVRWSSGANQRKSWNQSHLTSRVGWKPAGKHQLVVNILWFTMTKALFMCIYIYI